MQWWVGRRYWTLLVLKETFFFFFFYKSHLELHKDRLGSAKGKITFDYLRAKTEDGQFDCNLFAVQFFVAAQADFFSEFEAFKSSKNKPVANVPSSYP